MVGEMLTSAFLCLFYAIAALITGGAVYLGLVSDFNYQLALFAFVGTAQLPLYRHIKKIRFLFGKSRQTGNTVAGCQQDSAGLVGGRAVANADFINGYGKVQYRGACWEATSHSTHAIKEGDRLRITGSSDLLLQVITDAEYH